MDLRLSKIRRDGGTQPRAELNDERVEHYAEAYREGQRLPPVSVVFDGSAYWLWDGFHRCAAALRAGLDTIQADLTQGTQEDAAWLSYGANAGHDAAGLYRSNADKRRAVLAALGHPKGASLSDGAIAKHVGLSDRTVAKYRADVTPKDSESAKRTGLDGRTIDTGKIGKRPKTGAVPAPERQDGQFTAADCDPPAGCSLVLLGDLERWELLWVVPHVDSGYVFRTWAERDCADGLSLAGDTRGIIRDLAASHTADMLKVWRGPVERIVIEHKAPDGGGLVGDPWNRPWSRNELLFLDESEAARWMGRNGRTPSAVGATARQRSATERRRVRVKAAPTKSAPPNGH